MKIAVIGTGYVGLVSGLGLASVGHDVVCLDINSQIIEQLRMGKPTFFEEGLPQELRRLIQNGQIAFDIASPEILKDADVILISVGTPSLEGDIDLRSVRSASRMAGQAINLAKKQISVIIKSTVIPGTTSGIVKSEIDSVLEDPAALYGLGMNPEFLREGSAMHDFQNPDRIVIGYEDEIARTHLSEMYSDFSCPKVEVNTKTAELIKYANNFILALQISASNEIANLATAIGDVDPLKVMNGVVLDRRWSGDWQKGDRPYGISSYLSPGPGFGGSCFPKDVEALVSLGKNLGAEQLIAEATLKVNKNRPEQIVSQMFGDSNYVENVLVLGLAFKPNTDDVRESPAYGVISSLQSRGAIVHAHDPLGKDNFNRIYGDSLSTINYVDDWKNCVGLVDTVIIVTPWQEYLEEIPRMTNLNKRLIDPRRAVPREKLPSNWTYKSLGL